MVKWRKLKREVIAMDNQVCIGPVLTEERFFALLSDGIRETKEAKAAYAAGECQRARHIFAEYVRGITDIDKFFDLGGGPYRPEISEKTQKVADLACQNYLSSCGEGYQFGEEVDWFFNPTFNQYSEWTWQLSRHSEIGTLSTVYCATHNEKYAEKAVALMLSWIKQATRPEDGTSPYHTLCWRTIECGLRIQTWTDVLHRIMQSPAMTDGVLCLIFRSIYEHCHRLRIDHAKGTNWLVMEMTGLSKISMTFPVFAESEDFLSYSLSKLNETFYLQMHPDGFQYELTTCYHSCVIDQCMVVANLVERYGKRMDEKFYNTIEKALMLYIRLAQSGFIVPDLSDGNYGPIYNFIYRHAYHFPGNENLTYIMTREKEGKITIPTSVLLENTGIVTSRDTWVGGGRVSFLFDAGKLGSNHQHEDKLNLIVSACGKGLLVESNRYAYDKSDIRTYVLGSSAHNTVLVDGMGQNRKKGYSWTQDQLESVENIPVYFSEDVDFAHGVYEEGYGPDALRLARHERDVIFVKKPKEGLPYVVAIDTLTAEEEHTFEAVWHYDTKEDVDIKDGIISFSEMTTFLAGDIGECRIVKGQTEPFVQGIICRSTRQGDYEAIPTLIHKTKGTSVKTASVFVPTGGEECFISSVAFCDDLLLIVYKNGETDAFSPSELMKKAK